MPPKKLPSVNKLGGRADAGINGLEINTGTESLIPCPWDQEILTSNWGGIGSPLSDISLGTLLSRGGKSYTAHFTGFR